MQASASLHRTGALALPMILGQAAQILMHVIDAAMVGHLGVETLAAAAMGNNAASLCLFVGVALGSTVPAFAARAFGAGDRGRMNLVLRHGLAVSLLYAVGCAALFAAAAPSVLPLFGPDELATPARPYATWLVISLVPALLLQNLRGFAEAQNRPWLPFGNIALGLLLNVALNYGLIYGRFGLPALGLTGAAIGTFLARCVMLVHFAWLLQRERNIAPAPGWWRPVPRGLSFFGEYFRFALPMAAMIVVLIGNTVVVAIMMGRIGATALAANEIARQLASLLFTLPLGFSHAIAIRVAQAAGAGEAAGARSVAWSGVAAASVAMAGAGAVVLLARDALPPLFVGLGATEREPVLRLAADFLAAVGIALPAEGLLLACIGAFRGWATLRAPAAIFFTGYWCIGLPAAYGLGFAQELGGRGVWVGIVAGEWLTALVLAGLLARQPTIGTARRATLP